MLNYSTKKSFYPLVGKRLHLEKTFVVLKKLSFNQRNSCIDIRVKKHLLELNKFLKKCIASNKFGSINKIFCKFKEMIFF